MVEWEKFSGIIGWKKIWWEFSKVEIMLEFYFVEFAGVWCLFFMSIVWGVQDERLNVPGVLNSIMFGIFGYIGAGGFRECLTPQMNL